jgi:hypothetical protein
MSDVASWIPAFAGMTSSLMVGRRPALLVVTVRAVV